MLPRAHLTSSKEPFSRAPKRLQDIMMKSFIYDIEFRFVKGVNLIMADALSRAFVCNDNNDDCEQRPRIMNVNAHMYTGQNVRVHTTWTVLLSLFAPSFFRTVLAHAKRILRKSCSKTAPTPFLLILTQSRERDGTDARTDKERSSLELVK
jgi:hypothetical protein